MKRFALSLVLAAATACAVGIDSPRDLQSVHSKATARRCVRSLDLTGVGYMQKGLSESFHDHPAANAFSDDWIDLEWVVANRALHARITNRAKFPIAIDGVIVRAGRERTVLPRSS